MKTFLTVVVFLILFSIKCSSPDFIIPTGLNDTDKIRNTEFWKSWFDDFSLHYNQNVCHKIGFFANKVFCNKYCQCKLSKVTGKLKKYDFTCENGTFWDTRLGKCYKSDKAKTFPGCEYHMTPEISLKNGEELPWQGIETAKYCIYDLHMHYLLGSPDGVQKRIIGFNGQFPGPTLRCTRGKTMVVRVTNAINDTNEPTSIHWHGIEQHLTPYYDGPEGIAQCPIIRDTSMIYQFQLFQSGTYWYHSHHSYQYVDGAWGLLIIRNTPNEVWQPAYDEELEITINDWYHPPARNLSEDYLINGIFPIPDSSLINGRGYFPCANVTADQICNPNLQSPAVLDVVRGKRYRIRILNSSAFTTYNFTIDDHKFVVIEMDGVDTVISPQADILPILAAQRYSLIMTMDQPLDEYWIRISGEIFPVTPTTFIECAVLRYVNPATESEGKQNKPQEEWTPVSDAIQSRYHYQDIPWENIISMGGIIPSTPQELKEFMPSTLPSIRSRQSELDAAHATKLKTVRLPTTTPIDPSTAILLDQQSCPPYESALNSSAPSDYDILVHMNTTACDLPDNPGARLCINGNQFVPGGTNNLPVLFQVIKNVTVDNKANPIYTPQLGEVIRIVINNRFEFPHPWHLHGHSFWVLGSGNTLDGDFDPARDNDKLTINGCRRDTTFTMGNSWAVIAFVTNNPGVWFFHCHINWHLEAGLGATFIEAENIAQRTFKQTPEQTVLVCERVGVNIY